MGWEGQRRRCSPPEKARAVAAAVRKLTVRRLAGGGLTVASSAAAEPHLLPALRSRASPRSRRAAACSATCATAGRCRSSLCADAHDHRDHGQPCGSSATPAVKAMSGEPLPEPIGLARLGKCGSRPARRRELGRLRDATHGRPQVRGRLLRHHGSSARNLYGVRSGRIEACGRSWAAAGCNGRTGFLFWKDTGGHHETSDSGSAAGVSARCRSHGECRCRAPTSRA